MGLEGAGTFTGRLTEGSVMGLIGSGAGVSGLNWGTKVGVNLLGVC